MEIRDRQIMINRAGGNASKNAVNYRVSLPAPWMDNIGISELDKDVELIYDEEKKEIIIRKKVIYCIKCNDESDSMMVSEEKETVSKYYKCKKCNAYFKKIYKINSRDLIEEKEVDKSEVVFV